MSAHKMSLYADGDQMIHLVCIEPDCKTNLEIGHTIMVGRVIEAFADHQKAISTTEQGALA